MSNNYQSINDKIKSILKELNRDDEVVIVAVTKTFEADIINESVESGVKILAENRVNELLRKKPQVKGNVSWHLIGHLQKNKVNKIVGEVDLIHSVDSVELLKKIDDSSKRKNLVSNVLIQVNVAKETQKYGVYTDELDSILDFASELSNVRVLGLMSIMPFTDDKEYLSDLFKKMKDIFDELKQRSIKNVSMKYLSMGMSGDFELAVRHGANMLRIGSAIYKES